MIKLAGMLLLAGCGTLLGFARASRLSEQASALELVADFVRQFRVRLGLQRAAPSELVAVLSRQGCFARSAFVRALAEACRGTQDFSEAIRRAVGACPEVKPIADLLRSFGESVGVKALEAQLSDLDADLLLLEKEAQRARAASEKYGNLYRRLGLLGGLLAAVLFL